MLRASCALWIVLLLGIGWGANGLIEIVEEQQCHDQEFRLTCRELQTHIAVLEAWYTSLEDLLINATTVGNQTDGETLPQNDDELNQVYVYSSPNNNGYFEITNKSRIFNVESTTESLNETFQSVNDTFEVFLNDVLNRTEDCGVDRELRSYSSWRNGVRKTPMVYRDTSINLRAPVSYRCTGVNHCSFILEEDYPPAQKYAPGVVFIKYACFDDSLSVHYCNRLVAVAPTGEHSEGYVRTPGYPHFYIGDECRWKLKVDHEQLLRITFLDISLRSIGPFEDKCTDYVTVEDSNGKRLFSSCEQVGTPLELVSLTNEVEVIVNARSQGAFPKRGVLFHYKSIHCVTLPAPSNGYLVYRNEKIAHYVCNVNHVFEDTRERVRNIWCYDDNRWNDSVPLCIEDWAESAAVNVSFTESREKDAKMPHTEANMIVDIVIPSLLIAALFIGNAFIVLIIYKYRKRKTDDIEDEFNTIPLSVNGNIHSAGNAV